MEPRNLVVEETTWKKIERIFTQEMVLITFISLSKKVMPFSIMMIISTNTWVFFRPEITVEDNLDKYFDETQSDWVFVDCFKKAETKLAFIPGIESHYFGQLFGIIGHYIFNQVWHP